MKVWVIMGNDYPDAVFLTKAGADTYVEHKKVEQAEHIKQWGSPRIYWRHYEFNLQNAETRK